jgi:large repetitive protein
MISQKKRPCKLTTVCIIVVLLAQSSLFGFTLTVQEPNGTSVNGFRWLVEQDTTNYSIPGAPVANSIGLDIHNSYAPVVLKGHSSTSVATVNVPTGTRYIVSVLPDAGHAMGGKLVNLNQSAVTVVVNRAPIPTAQITVLAFNDNSPINNAPDGTEPGLEGFTVVVAETGGPQMMDAFGNALGTTYQLDPVDGSFVLVDGAPVVETPGSGVITTDANGEATIKYLAPGKYAIQVIPPAGTSWLQTATIEGTKVVDAWVKANEPSYFIEGFGAGFYHVFIGFVDRTQLPWAVSPPTSATGSISGRVVFNHFSRPPFVQGFFSGEPVSGAWVGLNDGITGQGLYAAPCNPDGTFTINNVPEGLTYQLVTWDENLDALFGFHSVTVPAGPGSAVNLGDVLSFRWFGKLEGSVFYDADADGFRDAGEPGMLEQNVNIRFRDGTIYKAQPTDLAGEYAFEEVFPFFKWLVVEVDFARFNATGMTAVVDGGGEIQPDNGWAMPSRDKLNPQAQVDAIGHPINNPNTGNNLSRTEAGVVLTEAMHLFLTQTNIIDWGKISYAPGENGGISGMVIYDTTRAEDDPRYGAAEEWQPGIPRVQVNLYMDSSPTDGVIDDLNGDTLVTLADVDNYPFGWQAAGAPGPEDVDRNGDGFFNAGDAIQITTTDSWDDSKPTGSIGPTLTIHGQQVPVGMDNFATWNQIRPAIFDGGYAFDSYFPGGIESPSIEVDGLPSGTYIVESTLPPGYEVVKEEDKNVDFGDQYIPALLPPIPVGDLHTVPAELTLFPGVPAPFAGESRPLADRKQVVVSSGKNAAADFFLFTEVPKAARAVGFMNNDLSAEFDTTSPVFGEKAAPSWLPISIQDWAGNEMGRVYSDEYGSYNAMIPSTFTVNVPSPSGVAPHMVTLVLNHPGPIPDPSNPSNMIVDPYYDSTYSTTPWTFHYLPGTTSYLDTPLVPLAAFAGYPNYTLDCEPPDETPVIFSAEGPAGGPVLSAAADVLEIKSVGQKVVGNPDYDPDDPGSTPTITRDFGFGGIPGSVTINGIAATVTWWENARILVEVDFVTTTTGTLVVTRGDNGLSTDLNLTVHIAPPSVTHVTEDPWPATPIQNAIDLAASGDLIVVHPGTYNENVILYKDVILQGSGAESTIINANPQPVEKLGVWHAKIAAILGNDPFGANEAPGIMVLGNAGFAFGPGSSAVIDGFSTMGSLAGGGIYVNSLAHSLEIRHNKVQGNQGSWGGGITIGTPALAAENTDVHIHDNYVVKNGGIKGGGGISIYTGAHNYIVKDNLIMGNFARNSGGGIFHSGLSRDGLIEGNRIVSNEVFFGLLVPGGGDGGGIFVGSEAPTMTGAGSVTINSNLIQGNIAGSGSGGGIRALMFNGDDVGPDPAAWYSLNVFNNLIVNNVAAYAGGGIALQDVAKVHIVNNTVANNASTATAALAFPPGNLLLSNPQGAGIVSSAHSAALAASSGQLFSDSVLHDNIIWHNSSFYWDGTSNGNLGGILPNPAGQYQDLLVSGVGGTLNPQNCVLSNAAGYPNNSAGDPAFMNGYTNTLLTASVLDEGGNFITTRFTPIGIQGDYHIMPISSAAGLGAGTYISTFVQLSLDYDGQDRAGFVGDSGADQITTIPHNAAPVIASTTATPALIFDTQTSQLLVTATDADGPSPLSFNWIVPPGGGSVSDPTVANPVYTPPDVTTIQVFALTVEVSDGSQTRVGTVDVTVHNSTEVIVDNLDVGVSSVGTWSPSSAAGSWATDSVYNLSAGSSFTFTATLMPGTPYAVYAWWTDSSNRHTAVPYQISSGTTVLDTVNKNQQDDGGQWNQLGVYTFSDIPSVAVLAGSGGVVTIADAVRFVPLTQFEVIVDNLDAGVSSVGAWSPSSLAGSWATNSVYSTSAGSSFTFTPALIPGTPYAVYAWWTAAGNRHSTVPYRINSGATVLDTVNVNQQTNGGQWNQLGVYTFSDIPSLTVLAGSGGAVTVADAVRFVPLTPAEVIVDNLNEGVSSAGAWSPSSAAGSWATNSVYSASAGTSFTFTPALVPGTPYAVYAWWTAAGNRHSTVPYRINSGATVLGTVNINQQTNGGQWNPLGVYTFSDIPSVTVLAGSGGVVTIADAVRFVPLTPAEVTVDNLDAGTSSVGTWSPSSAADPWPTNSVYSVSAGASFTFTPALVPGTPYTVYAWWTAAGNRHSTVPYRIDNGATELGTVNVNQQTNGGQWNPLGVYTFTDIPSVTILGGSGGVVTIADAVRFVPVP